MIKEKLKKESPKYIKETGFINRTLRRGNSKRHKLKKNGYARSQSNSSHCVKCGLAFIAPAKERCQCKAV